MKFRQAPMMKAIALLSLFTLFKISVYASDIVRVIPLTDQIIMVQFKDGYVQYHGHKQKRGEDKVVLEPLNTSQASTLASYFISSEDDPNYASQLNPKSVSRKTKGVEFTWICENWGDNQCNNTSDDHVKGHWIYLHLPTPMQTGNRYKIEFGKLAGNIDYVYLDYDESVSRSEAIHINQIGYVPTAAMKFGYVYHWMGSGGKLDLSGYEGNNFHLIDLKTNAKVFTGSLTFRKDALNPETGQVGDTPQDNFVGADVYECDFSQFKTPGEYVLSVEGIGRSFPFKIDADVYRQPYFTTIRGLYHHRSGIELKAPYTEYIRPAPHRPGITPGFKGKLKYTTSRFIDWEDGNHAEEDKPAIEAGILGDLDTWGWYQDAGDWDGYITHMTIPNMLMQTYELKPENFLDDELNIPESGNGIPDILDEASFLIRFFHRTRQELMDKGYGTGGIGSRVCGDHFGGDGEGNASYDDVERIWIVSGEDPHTTYKYAGLAAQLAYNLNVLGMDDPEGVDWEKEAIEAYKWAKENTRNGDGAKKPAISQLLRDYRLYAAASLYRITENVDYHNQFITDASYIEGTTVLGEEGRWGPYLYALLPEKLLTDDATKENIMEAILTTADQQLIYSAEKRAMRWGGNWHFPMLIGQGTTPWVFEGMIGYHISKDNDVSKANEYLSYIATTCDYFLGANPLNMTWVTQLGERYPERVFHMDSWYNGKDDMAPGIVPYGPWRDQEPGALGPWDLNWPYKTIFPKGIENWPGHERWFNNYTTPLNAEYTVHQNMVYAAVAFGFLAGKADGTFVPNTKPAVAISSHKEGETLDFDDEMPTIEVTVSDPDGDETISRVEYYHDWHKIGESDKAPFSFQLVKPIYDNEVKLRAKVFDKEGAWKFSEVINLVSKVTGIFDVQKNENPFDLFIYPNPGSEKLISSFFLKSNAKVKIKLNSFTGQELGVLFSGKLNAGQQDVELQLPQAIEKGMYFLMLEVKNQQEVSRQVSKVLIN
ncbi:glycoside hydrolase family 9 protein [Flexithrix dorotheae]|uniref:glycoside hydrolase family 9 protein n=1 Tax=Flexithrix dorotheae TaxID=70993 RepID=UPI000A06CCC1|nr:glycoside hydrolase family 9 protein [Flexithrix dorotheae]